MRKIILTLCACCVALMSWAQTTSQWITSQKENGALPLITAKGCASLCFNSHEPKGVVRAINDLRQDFVRVTGKSIQTTADLDTLPKVPVVIGTLGHNKHIDRLVKTGKIKEAHLKGKWESFVVALVPAHEIGVEQALVIAGSDRRGTIYGIYELSRQIGVSPWYWWADVPVKHQDELFVKKSLYYASGEPAVKYRGIFINDEFPCMTAWAKEKFGGMNSRMYSHMYELLLRLRANCLWPGMWGSFKEYNPTVPILRDEWGYYEGNCFNEDDVLNPKMADEYGIVMGTSHHEPMMRSQQEWIRRKTQYGNAEWNWMTNEKAIKRFFAEGIRNTKDYENLVTIGMRGDEDKPMTDAGSAEENFRIMENIIAAQRKIIARQTGKPAEQTPQVWTLYSEVLDYYDQGLKVPEDVIVMLCDDNFGHVRRVPSLDVKKRHPGGYGMYYHVGYYGAPRAHKWINASSIVEMWEQMTLTYDYGVDKLWMLNVGDLKPHEYPIDFFMEMAWNPKRYDHTRLDEYRKAFCSMQFGEEWAGEIAQLLAENERLAQRVTPEMLDDKTYNLNSGELKGVRDEFMALEARAARLEYKLPKEMNDAYYELVLYPIRGFANLYDLYYSLAMNKKMAKENNPEANHWADEVERCYVEDSLICARYNHEVAGGKWNHMADQEHIGYDKWHGYQHNIRPKTLRVDEKQVASLQQGYTHRVAHNVVSVEAIHPYKVNDAAQAKWTVVKHLGRGEGGLMLLPHTASVEGTSVEYALEFQTKQDSVDVYVTFACIMPFFVGGHYVKLSMDGNTSSQIGLNQKLNWENKYNLMYPAAAARIIKKRVKMAVNREKIHKFVVEPMQPGIILEKIEVDLGEYEQTHLGLPESTYTITIN